MGSDFKSGIRQLSHSSAFVQILSLSVGVGLTIAVFAVVHEALFRALPVSSPHELVVLTNPEATFLLDGNERGRRTLLSYSEFGHLRSQMTTMEDVSASSMLIDKWPVRIGGGVPEDIRVRLVSGNYFSVFGLTAAAGRLFTDNDTTSSTPPSAVIGFDYWSRRFNGDPRILGTSLTINRKLVSIVGVAPKGFHGETTGQSPDAWMLIPNRPQLVPGSDWLQQPALKWLHVLARLKPNVTLSQAQSEIDVRFGAVVAAEPQSATSSESRSAQTLKLTPLGSGIFSARKTFQQQWLILMMLACAVLAIACLNTMNIQSARMHARAGELGIRLSLGATRRDVIQQHLVECLILSLLSTLLGASFAWGVLRVLHTSNIFLGGADLFLNPTLTMPVILFSGITILCVSAFIGLPTALSLNEGSMASFIQDDQRTSTPAHHRYFAGKVLVVLQVAVGFAVLVATGLYLRTLSNLQAVPLGYQSEGLLLLRVDSLSAGYKGERRAILYREIRDRLSRIPGVTGVSYAEPGLFDGTHAPLPISIPNVTVRRPRSWVSYIGPRYFSTLGIPLVAGREIVSSDTTERQRICVVNEAFVNRFFNDRSPLGLQVQAAVTVQEDEGAGTGKPQMLTIVGIVKNFRDRSLRDAIAPQLFVPVDQEGLWPETTFLIRTATSATATLTAARNVIARFDEGIHIMNSQTLLDVLERYNSRTKAITFVCLIFGIVAILLGASGVYGLLSYTIERRTPEIAVRMAIGAQRHMIMRMVLVEVLGLALAGLLLGATIAANTTSLIADQLFGISSTDPATFAISTVAVLVVALAGGVIPALRASRYDVVNALRRC